MRLWRIHARARSCCVIFPPALALFLSFLNNVRENKSRISSFLSHSIKFCFTRGYCYARESIFSILLYVCSQNLSVENSYTNTQYGNTNNVALRITWFEFSIYHTQQKFPNIYHLVYTQVGNYSNCLERKYKQYEFSFSRINVLLKCNIHR